MSFDVNPFTVLTPQSAAINQQPTVLGPLASGDSAFPSSGAHRKQSTIHGSQPPDVGPESAAPKARLAYVLAASHSGSTLLTMLLGAQEEACTGGELKATNLGDPERYRCSCRKLIRECDFWKRVNLEAQSRGISGFDITSARTSIFDVKSRYATKLLSPLYRGAILERLRDIALDLSSEWRTHLALTQRRNLVLIQSLLAVTGAKIAIDSSKIALRLKYLLRIPELETKVIRVIRDGRAVSLTYVDDWNFADCSDTTLRNGGTGQFRKSVRGNMVEAANEWKRSNEAADALLARLPKNQYTEVRYEELCADPKRTLRRLSEFLGLDPEKVNLNFRSKEQHVIGNGMRFDTTSEIKLDERWKTHLTKEDLETFERVAGNLNRKYGYV